MIQVLRYHIKGHDLAALAILSSLCSCGTSAFANDLTATIRFTEVHYRVLPTENITSTAHSVSAAISADGKINQSETSESGRMRKGYSGSNKLGASSKRTSWRVAGPNSLVHIVEFPSYRRAILLTISGGKCSAEVDYKLKPGFKDFRYRRLTNNENAVATKVMSREVSCTIR